ncbi:MAG: P-type conjugative transfer protein TrbG [Candidatus Binatus sp.]|uniref:P-type conjugative transfer protein TrbG n=1 Tax=Candidatus Binatus sp. TaxID=2811406 RepID=UPI003C766C46
MRRIAIAGTVTLALTLGACAAKPPPTPPPLNLVTEAEPKAEAPPALPTPKEILAEQPPEVQQALKEHDKSGDWAIYRTPGYTLYPYNQGPPPTVDCEPLRTSDIQLQPGETITDVAIGDSERWMATPASSGDPRNPVPHLAVKPQAPGIQTNLTIYTTKHIYHLLLRSRGSHAVQEVEFYYPDELMTAMKTADSAAKTQQDAAADPPGDASGNVVKVANVDPAQLNFAYTVGGANVPWKPIRAFDDGSHVYIQMPPGMKSSEAPALLVNAGSGTQMVNYRVKGNYYVVDRLVTDAILVSGVGRDQDRVTISYAGLAR